MSDEIRLSEDGERVLREAQTFCWRANVAIIAAEHLLAGALAVLADAGSPPGVPGRPVLEAALMLTQGSADAHGNQVMFGSAARDAMNAIAGAVRESGGSTIDALTIARGTIDSGEVSPMFFDSLGVPKAQLRAALSA